MRCRGEGFIGASKADKVSQPPGVHSTSAVAVVVVVAVAVAVPLWLQANLFLPIASVTHVAWRRNVAL